jgi:ribosomal protein S18 acetylase RimI-like enzyme
MMSEAITYQINSAVTNAALNALFDAAWEQHRETDFAPIHARSLCYVCAFDGERLVGYVNVAWDGGVHAFLLDTTVHPAFQRRGIGRALVRLAANAARTRGIEWLHVDFEPHLTDFYRGCGFDHTEAGVMNLL